MSTPLGIPQITPQQEATQTNDFRSAATDDRADSGTVNGTGDTIILGPPDNNVRIVNRLITVKNTNTGAAVIQLILIINTTRRELIEVTLQPKQSLIYEVQQTLDDPGKTIVAVLDKTHPTDLHWTASWEERRV